MIDPDGAASLLDSILQPAAAVLEHYGFDGMTSGAVAAAAGVSRSTVDNYFSDRATFLDTVVGFEQTSSRSPRQTLA